MGATQASAGILAPYIEGREESPLLALAVRSLRLYESFVTIASAESGVTIPYKRIGTLDVAHDEHELRTLEYNASVLARREITAHLLDAAAARVEEPHLSESIAGALVIDAHGFVGA